MLGLRVTLWHVLPVLPCPDGTVKLSLLQALFDLSVVAFCVNARLENRILNTLGGRCRHKTQRKRQYTVGLLPANGFRVDRNYRCLLNL